MMVFPILNAVGLKQVDMGCVPLSVDVFLNILGAGKAPGNEVAKNTVEALLSSTVVLEVANGKCETLQD